MCCRYWFVTTPELWPAIEEMNRSSLAEAFRRRGRIVTEGEVRPSDVSPVVAMNRRGERKVFPGQNPADQRPGGDRRGKAPVPGGLAGSPLRRARRLVL